MGVVHRPCVLVRLVSAKAVLCCVRSGSARVVGLVVVAAAAHKQMYPFFLFLHTRAHTQRK